ncbi:MAG: ABC transporter substrate-binding protein [Pseudonocardiales bacterium]|jgi:NitT/TauT family transport system substrate-binding protein|nr:ABC transporter substrate-binding protein [Pseudonocardiales bacterium]
MTRSPSPGRRLRLPAVLLTMALLLAGCGGGAAPGAAGGPLRIASASSSLSAGPLLAAMALDTFTPAGIAYEYTDFAGNSPNTIAALSAGAADVALVGAASGWDALQEGAPLVVVAAIAGNTSELGMRTDVAQRLGITETSPIEQRVQALRGLTIATARTGSANYQMLRSLFTLYGLNPDTDATIVPSEPTAIVAGLQNDGIDAAFYGTGVMQTNYADGTAVPMVNLPRGDVPELEDIVFATALVRTETLENDPARVEQFVTALRAAGTAITDRGEETRAAVKDRYFPDLPDEVYRLSWDQVAPAWILDGTLSPQQLTASLDFQTQTTGKPYDGIGFEDDVAPIARS